MPSEVILNVELSDAFSAPVCSDLVVEFIKYVAYQRQQIPYPFKHLKSILMRREDMKSKSEHLPHLQSCRGHATLGSIQADHEFRKVSAVYNNLQATFKQVEEELTNSCENLEEVAILLGATPFSPRDVYRLQFPPIFPCSGQAQHTHQRSLLEFFQCLINSNDLHSHMSQPLALTNLFVLVRKKGAFTSSSGFTPKEKYSLPTSGRHAILRFRSKPDANVQCVCRGIVIYNDNHQGKKESVNKGICSDVQSHSSTDSSWFEAKNCVKGFKDLKINGVSVTSIWLQKITDRA